MKQIYTTLFLFTLAFLNATIINVPDDQATIQLGIDAAIVGDTVLVAPGTYNEWSIQINIDIVVGSYFITTGDTIYIESTIVDGNGITSPIFVSSNTSRNAMVIGLTICNGGDSYSGAFWLLNSITISYNLITGNHCTGSNYGGGAISLFGDGGTISNNKIIDNVADGKGGGIWINNVSNGNVNIYNNIIENNHSTYGGGGIACIDGIDPVIEISNNVIRSNTSNIFGGGIYCNNSNPIIHNNTFNNNSSATSGANIFCINNANPDISNNTIEGGAGGFWHGGAIGCDINSNPEITENIIIDHQCVSIISVLPSCIPQVRNNTFYNNSSLGGLIETNSADVIIENNIFISNSGIVISSGDPNVTIGYNDFYNQSEPLFGGSLPAGIGIITQTNANGDSCDVYYNLYGFDPCFENCTNNDFHLLENSPCIDAGNPVSPFDPDGTIADMGAFYYDQMGGIASPENAIIEILGSSVHLSWDAVIGADSYKVYSSDDPYTGFMEDLSGSFAGESWSTAIINEKKFYYVKAVRE